GRMSLMAKIFTLLSLSVPGDVAFHEMNMRADISDAQVLIRDLHMSGESLNFRGSGVIDLDRRLVNIDLAATSPTPAPDLLSRVMTGLRYATVYLKVRGELNDPMVHVAPLPMLDKAIERVLGTRE
ncbi:MAG TPA: AsmA-like C-terminal domain-containing protein, partial [Sedimentisphaerales bacterium]|nr:AsmA-like C-terminal domain-containing protein [Sedimentisphaerales bacterium]